MVKFYLIRHGETDWNHQGRFQGIENIPLNMTGIRQAKECGKGLKTTGIPFDCVVSSPLDRAYVTAEIVAGYAGIVAVQREDRLIERDFGKVSGRKREERERMLASEEDLGLEPESAVADRVQAVLEQYGDGTFSHILVVTHGAAIRALLGRLTPPGSVESIAVQRNASLTVLTFENGRLALEAFDKLPNEL